MKNSIKPDKKLLTKQWHVLLTLQFLLLLIALILQIFVPLGGKVSSSEISSIVWPIYGSIIFFSWIITAPIVVLWIKNLEYMIEDDRIIIHKETSNASNLVSNAALILKELVYNKNHINKKIM